MRRPWVKGALLGGFVLGLTVVVLALVVGGPSETRPSNPAATDECDQEADTTRRDLILSFDAEPPYCEWDSIQSGFGCEDGMVDRSATIRPASEAFARDDSPGNVRHGEYSGRVVLRPGDNASYSCNAEAVFAIKHLDEREGSESWWGWSWKLPAGWRGTKSWGMLFEFTTNAALWPSYGMLNIDAATTNSLRLGLHTGLTPNPGSGTYNAAYEKWSTLLGPGAPRPMVYGKWLDFYMHVVWRSRTSGVLEIWYRVEGEQRFTKLYSNVPGGGALVQVPTASNLALQHRKRSPGGEREAGP